MNRNFLGISVAILDVFDCQTGWKNVAGVET